MVRAHDMFESAALTLEKGSTKEKHKDAFRTNAAEFFRAVKTVRDVLEFYAPKAPALPPSVIAPIASASSATAAFTPITVVRSRVPTTATAAATTPSASSATLTPSSPPPQPVSSSPASSAASASTPRRHHQQTDDGPKEKGLDTETSREERIGEMLADLDTTLMGLYSKMDDAIESFDNACNAEPPSNDTKALALLSVYTRMYQLNEDLKETGKDVAVIRGAPTSSTWHGQGGNYSVPIEIKSTK